MARSAGASDPAALPHRTERERTVRAGILGGCLHSHCRPAYTNRRYHWTADHLQHSLYGHDFASPSSLPNAVLAAEPLIQFADLVFPTPSGRIEIASVRAEAEGYPRVPLPLADPRPAEGYLRLLSPASSWRLNRSLSNVEKIAAHVGPATIALYPTDATERGLAEGDQALVANETGCLSLRVTLSDAVPRGVVLSHKGRWPKREEVRGNVNILNPGRKADMGENTCVHSVEVTVTRLAGG